MELRIVTRELTEKGEIREVFRVEVRNGSALIFIRIDDRLSLLIEMIPHEKASPDERLGLGQSGNPAVAFKFGFRAETPEAEAIRVFNTTHYHKPSDEVDTMPLQVEDEIRLHDFIVSLALRVANAPERPTWNADSIFGE